MIAPRDPSTLSLAPLVLSTLGLGALATPPVLADEPRVEVAADSIPDGLPDWLEPLLGRDGVEISSGGTLLAELWLRTELPAREPTGELGVEYGTLPEGALVGLVRLGSEWGDYKTQPIQPGLYTLRYGVQPADGDHTGQTWFRDFLMLVPVDKDLFVADGAQLDIIVEASKEVSTTTHPAVLALFQVYDPVSEPSVVTNDLGQPMAAVPVGDLVLGLVIEGHGEEATL